MNASYRRVPSAVAALLVVGGLLALVSAGGPPRAQAADEAAATFVGMKTCAACHAKIAEPWLAGAHGKALTDTNLPEGLFGCEACHGAGSRHVGSTGKQPITETMANAATADAVCAKCHLRGEDSKAPAAWPNLNPRDWRKTLHARSNTSCTSCHKVHGGAEHALAQPAGDLCLSCHKTVINPEAGGYTHAPVAKGQCTLCHTPHGSSGRHNLIPRVGTACLSCHQMDDALRAAHGKYAVDEADCTSCHNPHSTDRTRHLLRQTEHAPFRKCEVCHKPSEGQAKPALVKPVKELCTGCHPTSKIMPAKDENGKKTTAHAPVQNGMCTACHNPHAADQPALVKDRLENTCFLCHGNVEAETQRPLQHKPMATGNCLLCHKAHASANEKLMARPPLEQCQPCHSSQMKFTHPVGMKGDKPVIDPTTKKMLTCARCHAVHGANVRGLLPVEEDDLCRGCHKQ